jgi:hypothetical protein
LVRTGKKPGRKKGISSAVDRMTEPSGVISSLPFDILEVINMTRDLKNGTGGIERDEEGLRLIDPGLGQSAVGKSHDQLTKACISYLIVISKDQRLPFCILRPRVVY